MSNKIERVFTNVIKNAVEAMPNGGTLEITSVKMQKTSNLFLLIPAVEYLKI